ncbi:DUF4227 family protein [Paenibacillus eucommiae]|uniref:Alpha-N-acetylglucosamine transferase n=1 Tax=Paenibacillus eucommiae TaxID=1355755 RepID=A0ABS4IPL2_9BACL|nr:DUF4227 family protein [Paenibacillus eucommiae]MBP1988966.1 alpha-N-acetylglucosamine transferase [Paenibacillus eucommiae]
MIFSYHKWMARLRFIVLFMVLTFMLYHLLLLMTQWTQPVEKYKTPGGRAEKVFHQRAYEPNSGTLADRLRFFYWYGE